MLKYLVQWRTFDVLAAAFRRQRLWAQRVSSALCDCSVDGAQVSRSSYEMRPSLTLWQTAPAY